jgi:hypothetical protein
MQNGYVAAPKMSFNDAKDAMDRISLYFAKLKREKNDH